MRRRKKVEPASQFAQVQQSKVICKAKRITSGKACNRSMVFECENCVKPICDLCAVTIQKSKSSPLVKWCYDCLGENV